MDFDSSAFGAEVARCGYFSLLTNKSAENFTIEDAMPARKGKYRSEHTFRCGKGVYDLEPICLHYSERIEAYLFLFKIALQMIVLIKRAARQNIERRDLGLDNFMPYRHDVRNPKSEYLLSEFQYVAARLIPMADGSKNGFVSEFTPLQLDILSILEVPKECFSFQYLFDTS